MAECLHDVQLVAPESNTAFPASQLELSGKEIFKKKNWKICLQEEKKKNSSKVFYFPLTKYSDLLLLGMSPEDIRNMKSMP